MNRCHYSRPPEVGAGRGQGQGCLSRPEQALPPPRPRIRLPVAPGRRGSAGRTRTTLAARPARRPPLPRQGATRSWVRSSSDTTEGGRWRHIAESLDTSANGNKGSTREATASRGSQGEQQHQGSTRRTNTIQHQQSRRSASHKQPTVRAGCGGSRWERPCLGRPPRVGRAREKNDYVTETRPP